MRRIVLLIFCLTALSLGTAQGRECKGVGFPEQIRADSTTLTLNGLGLRQATIFHVSVYVAALYVAAPSNDPAVLLAAAAPAELVLHFVRDLAAADIRESWTAGFAKNAGAQLPALQDRIATLNAWMTDIKSGQQMVFRFTPGAGVQVSVNGTAKGTIRGDDFARALLSIWLGADPPNTGLKAGLLGSACP